MLEALQLTNFRGFENHEIPLRKLTVIVGANNAGKSTVVEALRLIALAVARFNGGAGFGSIPEWLDHPEAYRGITPVARTLDGTDDSMFHLYGRAPAVIKARFSSGATVVVFVGPEGELHAVARSRSGGAVASAAEAKRLGLTPIAIQPQVAPLLRDERPLQMRTVQRGDGSYLAPLHFRNQLRYFDEHFPEFKRLVEETWPGLRIEELIVEELHPEEPLRLELRNEDFVGEVALMGHGVQMWLQTVWFLARTPRDRTVVLDEPDVYMHPDLQRRLLQVVRERFDQLLIATHSIEIVSDVDPQSILSVDRRSNKSSFVTSLPGAQEVIDSLGGVHNIHLTRLYRSPVFLLVEGEDVDLLRLFQKVVAPNTVPIDLIPNADIGGRGGWATGFPSRLPRKNAKGDKIASYCILDRDFFPPEEIAERYAEAQQRGVRLHIWTRKEIENFVLVPEGISRFIASKVTKGAPPPSAGRVSDKLDEVVEGMKVTITDAFATSLLARDKRAGLPKANKRAREIVADSWTNPEARRALAPGKAVVSALSAWSQDEFGVSFGPTQIARGLQPHEVDPEIREVLTAIDEQRPFRAASIGRVNRQAKTTRPNPFVTRKKTPASR